MILASCLLFLIGTNVYYLFSILNENIFISFFSLRNLTHNILIFLIFFCYQQLHVFLVMYLLQTNTTARLNSPYLKFTMYTNLDFICVSAKVFDFAHFFQTYGSSKV